MPEETLFKTVHERSRADVSDTLVAMAEQIETGTVELASDAETQQTTVPRRPTFEVELERLTDSETGEQRYELEFEIRWTA